MRRTRFAMFWLLLLASVSCSHRVPTDLVGVWVQDTDFWRTEMERVHGIDVSHIDFQLKLTITRSGSMQIDYYLHNHDTGDVSEEHATTEVYVRGNKLFSGEGDEKDWEYFELSNGKLVISDPRGIRIERHLVKQKPGMSTNEHRSPAK